LIQKLGIRDMPSLIEVCVWEMPFPPDGVTVDKTNSPNVEFSGYCGTGFDSYTQKALSIYPNPTNSLLTIETDQSDRYSIEITTLNGQSVYLDKMEGTSHQLDLSSFRKGVYFITIRSEDFVKTEKIIKL